MSSADTPLSYACNVTYDVIVSPCGDTGRWSKHNCTAPWEDDEGDYYKKWMYSIDGGSGAILSRGLLEAIDHEEMERCVRYQ